MNEYKLCVNREKSRRSSYNLTRHGLKGIDFLYVSCLVEKIYGGSILCVTKLLHTNSHDFRVMFILLCSP